MTDEWTLLETFADRASATALVELLRTEGLPSLIDGRSPIPGLDESFSVMVPGNLVHRAQSLLASMQISDSELDRLATGQRRGTEEDPNA